MSEEQLLMDPLTSDLSVPVCAQSQSVKLTPTKEKIQYKQVLTLCVAS